MHAKGTRADNEALSGGEIVPSAQYDAMADTGFQMIGADRVASEEWREPDPDLRQRVPAFGKAAAAIGSERARLERGALIEHGQHEIPTG